MTASITLLPDTLLRNRYRVTHCIGGGGFSQVFAVFDGETEKVLKILDLSTFRHPQVRQKAIALFQREAEFLSQFRHPGMPVVEPDDYFIWMLDEQTPLHCLVMEKIPGVDLQTWQQQQQQTLTPVQAIAWLRQLVDILAHLHQRQFFHRDIKPANIMLKPDGQLVLIDFGAIREITETYLKKQQGQETGTAIVSAGYTPPEQAEGQAVPQSDFFALGRTFVYLFTGEDPLNLPKDPHTGQLLWRDRSPQVPQPLADLLDHLMASFPGQRPQTCEAIGAALQRLERDLFLQQWMPLFKLFTRPQQQRVGDRWQRSNLLKIAMVSAFITGGVNVWSNRMQLSDLVNNEGLKAYEAQRYDTALRYYQLALLFDPQSPIARFNLGNLYETQQQFDQARAAYQIAMAGKQWKAFNNLARLNILAGNYQQAVPLLEQGLQLTETAEDRYPLLKNLGWAQLGLKQYDQAQTTLQQAIDLDPRQAAAHCLMAAVLRAKVNIPDASTSLDQCFQYANLNDPDDRLLSDLARRAFPASEVQP